ncbi:unnamed protein product [Mesocestoides corti]|uniref:G-protein coupled receptors family 2 profile 2 domain-containing protein n=1 Tax=Mesocestoides corti TaxID=53468 RepID=A0A0R3UH36_MESCO|nr:unnamed protein product [Mesocestoides corti]
MLDIINIFQRARVHSTQVVRAPRTVAASKSAHHHEMYLGSVAVNERAHSLLAPVYANLTSSSSDEANAPTSNVTHTDVLGSVLASTNPGFCPDGSRAWFTNLGGLITWFLVPAGTMISFNSFALLIVCIQICRLSKEARIHASPQNEQEKKRRKKSKSLAGICAKLAIILGVCWFVQFFAGWWPQLVKLRRAVGLVNSAQGGVIALSMLVSAKARRALASMLPKRCRGFVAPPDSTTQQSISKDKERSSSTSTKTWTSVLLPKRNRSQTASFGNPNN